jgi:hypothetical protein
MVNSSPPRKLRTIRESAKAEKDLRDAFKKYERLEDVWTYGDTWRLVRGPDDGVLLATGERIMKFHNFMKLAPIPGRSVLYRYDDEFIDIIAVRFSEDE